MKKKIPSTYIHHLHHLHHHALWGGQRLLARATRTSMEVCSLEQQAAGLEVLWGTARSFATYQPHRFLQLNLPWFPNYPQWQLWSSQIARKFCLNPKMAQNHPPGETPLQKMRCPFAFAEVFPSRPPHSWKLWRSWPPTIPGIPALIQYLSSNVSP